MVESKLSQEGSKKGKPAWLVGYLKMKVMADLKASSINICSHIVIIVPDKKKAAKNILVGNHHNGSNASFVQNYLDEFCYKFNRLYFGDKLLDRLVVAALGATWY